MKIWLISDTHFNHANIALYETRPFRNEAVLEHIDKRLVTVEIWNGASKNDDCKAFLEEMFRPRCIKIGFDGFTETLLTDIPARYDDLDRPDIKVLHYKSIIDTRLMNETIIHNWNELIAAEDIVFHL